MSINSYSSVHCNRYLPTRLGYVSRATRETSYRPLLVTFTTYYYILLMRSQRKLRRFLSRDILQLACTPTTMSGFYRMCANDQNNVRTHAAEVTTILLSNDTTVWYFFIINTIIIFIIIIVIIVIIIIIIVSMTGVCMVR